MKLLSFLVTDRCNIACDFCAPGCGPGVRGSLDAAFMTRVYDQLRAREPVEAVSFSGGEPFLYRADVLETVAHIRARSPAPVHVVTNAYWAVSPERAADVLAPFVRAGLTSLNVSVDDFHEDFLPRKLVRHAVLGARALGLPVMLVHKSYPGSRTGRETYCELLGEDVPDVLSLGEPWWRHAPLVFAGGVTVPVGRGEEQVDRDDWARHAAARADWRGPCGEALATITVLPSGQLSPCCGLVDRKLEAFHAGDLAQHDAGELLARARRSTLYNWLALEGPSAIMAELRAREPSLSFRDRYAMNCEACQDLFASAPAVEALRAALPEVAGRLAAGRCADDARRDAVVHVALRALLRGNRPGA